MPLASFTGKALSHPTRVRMPRSECESFLVEAPILGVHVLAFWVTSFLVMYIKLLSVKLVMTWFHGILHLPYSLEYLCTRT